MSECTGSYTGEFEVTLEKFRARERFPTIRSFDVTTTIDLGCVDCGGKGDAHHPACSLRANQERGA